MADEQQITHEQILEMPISKYIANHPDKFKITNPHDWPYMLSLSIYNPYDKKFHHLSNIRQGETVHDQGRPYLETSAYIFFDCKWDAKMMWTDMPLKNGCPETYSPDRALFTTRGVGKTWFDTMTPNQLEEIYARFLGFYKNVAEWIKADKAKRKETFKERKAEMLSAAKELSDMAKSVLAIWKKSKCPDDYEFLRTIDANWGAVREAKHNLEYLISQGDKLNPTKKSETTDN